VNAFLTVISISSPFFYILFISTIKESSALTLGNSFLAFCLKSYSSLSSGFLSLSSGFFVYLSFTAFAVNSSFSYLAKSSADMS